MVRFGYHPLMVTASLLEAMSDIALANVEALAAPKVSVEYIRKRNI